MSIQEVLLYADDILLLCQTPEQMRKCIQIIETWCQENGMKLNKKKSGIVIFGSRKDKDLPWMMRVKKEVPESKISGRKRVFKEWIPSRKEFEGIPIVSCYKYLGTYLDSNLKVETQLEFIEEKSNHLFVRLYPYLSNATAGGRKDIWRTMICPLFNALLVLLAFEKSEAQHQKVLRLWHKTFKRFMMIPKSTNNELIDEMIGVDLIDLVVTNVQNSARKWYERSNQTHVELMERIKPKDYLKGIPKEWCMILKQQCSLCPLCRNSIRNLVHMEESHGVEIVPYVEIWRAMKDNFECETKKQKKKNAIMQVKRQVFLKYWEPILKEIYEETEEKFRNIFNNKSEINYQ